MKSTLNFCGGVGAVTGANFLLELEVPGKPLRIVVDCGLLQGVPSSYTFNHSTFPYDPASIDILFITHAHADHIGRVPKLVKDGFKGMIYSTPATLDLTRVMLTDQVKILDQEARTKGTLPMYEKKDVDRALSIWKVIPYHEDHEIASGINVYLKDAGHILGSAMIEITRGGRKIVFTGDLGNSPSLFLRDTEIVNDADYMIMESVYGDRNHEPQEERREHLQSLIEKTIQEKKTLVIPVFSLERTQDILFEINDLVESKKISIPVFVDSPLAVKVTDIYRAWASEYKPEIQERIRKGDDIFDFSKLKNTAHAQDSMDIYNVPNPKIVMAGSGMSAGGRIVNHEMHYLPDTRAILLFVGYQSLGTLGRDIQDGAKMLTIHDQQIPVKAEIDSIDGYSSHKDSEHLVEFVADTAKKVNTVFVAMGEPKSAMFLAQRLRDNLGVKAVCPELGNSYQLDL